MINSEDLEITDLFEDENVDDAAANAQHNEEDREEGNEKDESSANTTKVAAKKIIRNPQPKLNPQRLCGDRGIVQLPKIFSEVKLKGKGHEKEDLDIVMKTLEHWSHRLFPKFTFDDVLERIEKLGSKKYVQNCVNRIRLDMEVVPEDHVTRKDDDIVDSEDENPPPVIDEELHATIFGTASTSQKNHHADAASNVVVPQATKTLTADQWARIEQNRLLALEKRAARLREAATVQSLATLTKELPVSAEDTCNKSPVNTTDTTEQYIDNNTVLIDEDSPSDRDVPTENVEKHVIETMSQNKVEDIENNVRIRTTVSDQIETHEPMEVDDEIE